MKKLIASLLLVVALAFPSLALAQSSPNLVYGQVPTAAQWNSYFAAKQDTLGYVPLNKAGDSMLGRLVTLASATGGSSINVPPGVAPSAPVNGDVWTTSAGMFVRINGGTVGPLASSASTTLTVGSTVVNSGTNGYFLYNNAGVLANIQYVPLSAGGTNNGLTASNGGIVYSDASKLVVLPGTASAGLCLLSGSNAAPSWGSCVGGVTVSSVTAANATLTISPTTGAVIAGLNLSNANTWSARQTFSASATFPTGGIRLNGSSTGYTDFASANAGASNYTITFPASTGTVALTSGVVSSIAGNVGAFTLSTGITNATNDIRLDIPVLASRGGTGVVSPTANTIPVNAGASAQTNLALAVGECVVGNASSVPIATTGCPTKLNTITANNTSAEMTDTTSLTSNYRFYDIVWTNVVMANSSNELKLEIQSGGTWRSSGYITITNGTYSTGAGISYAPTTHIPLQGAATDADNALPGNSGRIRISNPSASALVYLQGEYTYKYISGNVIGSARTTGYWNTAAPVTGARLVANSGFILSGVAYVYGSN